MCSAGKSAYTLEAKDGKCAEREEVDKVNGREKEPAKERRN